MMNSMNTEHIKASIELEAEREFPFTGHWLSDYTAKKQRAAYIVGKMSDVELLERCFQAGWWSRDRAEKCREDVNDSSRYKQEYISKLFK